MKKNSQKNKVLYFFLKFLLIISVLAGVFCGAYYFIINKSYSSYEKNIKTHIDKISSINSEVEPFISGQSIDVDKVRKTLPNKAAALLKEKQDIENLNPTEKYKMLQVNLINGVNSNYLLYKQISSILDNPNGSDIAASLENLNKYKSDCINYYALVTLDDKPVTLPSAAITFINNTSSYVYTLIGVNKDKNNDKTKALTFTKSLDDLSNRFTNIKKDFSSDLDNVRNKKGLTYDSLISQINKNVDDFEKLYKDFSKLDTPPNSLLSSYNALKNTLEDYDLYTQNYKYAINTEKLQLSQGNPDKNSLDSLYTSAREKYSDMANDFENFTNVYKQAKNAVSN